MRLLALYKTIYRRTSFAILYVCGRYVAIPLTETGFSIDQISSRDERFSQRCITSHITFALMFRPHAVILRAEHETG